MAELLFLRSSLKGNAITQLIYYFFLKIVSHCLGGELLPGSSGVAVTSGKAVLTSDLRGVFFSGAVWWAGPGDNWCIILSLRFATLDVCISVNLSVTHSFFCTSVSPFLE